MNILLVDDDKATNVYNSFVLKKNMNNCEVITMNNGITALEYLKKGDIPDFIFLDINMPEMNGIQFLEEAQKSCEFEFNKIEVCIMMGIHLPEEKLNKINKIRAVKIIKRKFLANEDIHNLFNK